MNEEPTIEELKALIEDLKRQLALALDAVVARSGRASDTGGCSAFAAIRRTKYPHEYAGWNVERDSPKWTSDRLFAAPVPLETIVSELNKVAARETNIWAVVYHQDTPPMNTPETPIALALDAAVGRSSRQLDALFSAGRCPECGSRELTWHADTKNCGAAQDGRICMREVAPIFYLGCEECSETIKVVHGEGVAELLTKMQSENS